jgi:hypothetical protein
VTYLRGVLVLAALGIAGWIVLDWITSVDGPPDAVVILTLGAIALSFYLSTRSERQADT